MLNRSFVLGFFIPCALVFTSQSAEGPETKPVADIHAANRKLGRGINLGNALEAPHEGDWGVTLKPEYFRAIKEAGFASVRLPTKWSAHAKPDAPYTIDRKFAERLDWAIDQALANKLNIVVNVHHYAEMDSDPDKELPRLVGLWEQIAARYQDKPAGLYFELLNEPHEKLVDAKWNAVLAALVKVIRKTNPARPVIVGPAQWNAIGSLDKLELPKEDKNLIVTVHYYDPYQFTHQGASWVKGADKWKGRKWTGSDSEKAAVHKQLEKAQAWGKKHDRPIFLGEFGTFAAADAASRARWMHHVVHEAENLGFSWAYWEFCAGFGVYDPKTNEWRKALKAALLE
ncbi:MAG: glycoside hydrolase family 5 protein [Gemmataceae bacterium]